MANPDYLVIALDGPRNKTFRREMYHGYKLSREGKPPASQSTKDQISRCKEIIKRLGIKTVQVDKYEADDIIATIVDKYLSDDVHGVVVTRDKDLHQVVSDKCVIYDHQSEEWIEASDVEARWGVPPDKVCEMQTLIGDRGDCVPGVKGVAEKTALKLLTSYGTVDGIYDNIKELSSSLRTKFKKTDIQLMKDLVTLRKDVPIKLKPHELEFNGVDYAALRPLFEQLGFETWLAQDPIKS